MTTPVNPETDTAQFEADRAKFAVTYAGMADYELLNLKEQIATLKPGAKAALQAEIGRRDSCRWSDEPPLPSPYKGVRGWLTFFIFIIFLYPITTISNLLGELAFSKVSWTTPDFALFAILLEVTFDLALSWFAFTVAVKLWKVKPGAVQYTKKFLWAAGLYGIVAIVMLMVVAWVTRYGLPDFFYLESFRSLGNLPSAVIGYLYLRYSKRVAATYALAEVA